MQSLYLTAILPPESLSLQIDEIRKECAEKFNVKAGLKPPVHITLFRPFRYASDKEEHLIKILSPLTGLHQPFEIALENFDTFNTHTVFIRVLKNEHLGHLQGDISAAFNKHRVDPQETKSSRAFHPHITIAYRDIPTATFPVLWSEYKNRKFKRAFIADRFVLLKHDGQHWQPYREFLLKKQVNPVLF